MNSLPRSIPLILMVSLMGFAYNGKAQSTKAFKKLSSHEKCWVYFHPFKAKKAYKVSKEVNKTIDSILKVGNMGSHHAGNQLDAFKHAFWMWSLAEKIGYKSAKSLGKQHEKGNYEFHLQHKLEDNTTPDKVSCEMDLYNNNIGLELYQKHKKEKLSKKERIELVKQAVVTGKMRMIYQTRSGVYLDALGRAIPKEKYFGLWENSKCLVPSTSRFLMTDNKSNSLNLFQNNKQ
ncbi:DUF6973 domain-containing protein [Wenyingzhuangia sp. IMCC45533]